VPPVEAYAARHLEVEPTVAGASEPAPRSTTSSPGTTAAPATTTTTAADEPTFTPVAEADLDAMGTPSELTGDFQRMKGFQSTDGAMHLLYSDGTLVVSEYEQVGVLAWDRMPAGTTVVVDGIRAWTMVSDVEEVMVFERGPVVYTVVAQKTQSTHDEMVELAVELPQGSDPSMLERFRTSCRSMAARFSMGTSEP
jgi:hypothetical protein